MKKLEKYILVADESTKKGKYFSYFYGGAILLERDYELFNNVLNNLKSKLNLGEMKRTKITEKNCGDYILILRMFFTLVKSGDIKVRIMFSPNNELMEIPKKENLTYTKFYFAFIFNAFSLFYANKNIKLRLIFDDLPETKSQCNTFKNCIIAKVKSNKRANTNHVYIDKEQIEEVNSEKHPILQCIDVIVGIIDYYLNTPKNELKTSNRAKARYEIWKFISSQIESINPNFIITETTQPIYSHKGWLDRYKHFVYKQKKSPQHF